MSTIKIAPSEVAREASKPTPPAPRVLDATELAAATGGRAGVILGSRAGVLVGG